MCVPAFAELESGACESCAGGADGGFDAWEVATPTRLPSNKTKDKLRIGYFIVIRGSREMPPGIAAPFPFRRTGFPLARSDSTSTPPPFSAALKDVLPIRLPFSEQDLVALAGSGDQSLQWMDRMRPGLAWIQATGSDPASRHVPTSSWSMTAASCSRRESRWAACPSIGLPLRLMIVISGP